MAEAFIGLTIEITLKDPPRVVVQGLVAEVHPESLTLVLHNVYFPETGTRLEYWTVAGPQIADIKVSSQDSNQRQNYGKAAASNPLQVDNGSFADPAIVSYGKMPTVEHMEHHVDPYSAKVQSSNTNQNQPLSASQASSQRPTHIKGTVGRKKQGSKADPLVSGVGGLGINERIDPPYETDGPPLPQDAVRRVSVNKTRSGKPMDDPVPMVTTKRAERTKKAAEVSVNMKSSNNSLGTSPVKKGPGNTTYRGKGWRQTPILQPSVEPDPPTSDMATSTLGRQAAVAVKQLSRQQKALNRDANKSGWATEDATDIQDLPEFDFVGNLSKFDKQSVFDQIRNDDLTTDGERLVSHNRARPGTYGGKNLHPTEMVLDSPASAPHRHRNGYVSSSSSTASESNERASRRAASRRPFNRVNSGHAEDPMTVSQSSLGRSKGLRSVYIGSSSQRTGSPAATRFTPPESPSIYPPLIQKTSHFCINRSGRPCPTVTPGGMLAIEEFAETEFGLIPDIITENAGRGIAEVALKAIRRSSDQTENTKGTSARLRSSRSSILVIAGNHRAGARALAAARHLKNRNMKITVCILGCDRPGQEQELTYDVKMQADILSRSAIQIYSWAELRPLLQQSEFDVVLEALLACSKGLAGLQTEDAKAARDIIAWVNSRATVSDHFESGNENQGLAVVSVDVPSGIHGSTGALSIPPESMTRSYTNTASTVTSPQLASVASFGSLNNPVVAPSIFVRATHIASIGAPRLGLLRNLSAQAVAPAHSTKTSPLLVPSSSLESSSFDNHRATRGLPTVYVVDSGVNRAWREYGVLGAEVGGVRFGSEWVIKVGLEAGSVAGGR